VKLSRTTIVSAGVTVAAAAAAVVTLTSASARTAVPHPRQISAAAARPAAAGQVGWQGLSAYGVPAGTNTLFFHYSCRCNRANFSKPAHAAVPSCGGTVPVLPACAVPG
jgi:hypothetical protein